MNRLQRTALNSLTSYARFGLNMVVFLFLTPFMIAKLGIDDYGIWSLVFSLVGFLGLLDLGFGAGVVKFVARARGSGQAEQRNRMLSTLLTVYLGLAVLALAGLAVLSVHLDSLFNLPPAKASLAVKVLWIIGLRAVVFNLPLSLWRGILFGEQQIHRLNGVQALASLVYGLGAWQLLAAGWGLAPLALLNLAVMLAEHLAYVVLAHRLTPDLKLRASLVGRDQFREAFGFSAWIFVVSVAALVLMRTDPIIVKLYLPLSAVSAYGLALRIAENSLLLTKQFVNVLSPLVAEMSGAGERDNIRYLLVNTTKFAAVPAAALAVGAWVLGREAITFWVGPGMEAAWPVLVVLMTAMALSVPQMVASTVLTMTGHHRFSTLAALISLAINLGLSLALIRPLGLIGVALGTLVATAVVDLGLVVWLACRVNGQSILGFFGRVVPAVVVPALAQLALTWGLKQYFQPRGLAEVVILALPGAVIYLLVLWLIFVDSSEKRIIRRKMLKWS